MRVGDVCSRACVLIALVVAAAPASGQILAEDFEGAFPPAGWAATSITAGAVDWLATADEGDNWTSAAPGRGLAAVADTQWTDAAYDVSLISPVISVGAQATDLTFMTCFETWTGLEAADVDVRVGAGDWTNVAGWTHADLSAGAMEGLAVVPLTPYAGQDIQVRFRYYNDLTGLPLGASFFGDLYWQVDAVTVDAALLRGDADLDGDVDLDDFVVLKRSFDTVGALWTDADFDGTGKVDLDDFVLLKQNFGNAAAVPEPATLALLGSGLLMLRRRR